MWYVLVFITFFMLRTVSCSLVHLRPNFTQIVEFTTIEQITKHMKSNRKIIIPNTFDTATVLNC